VDDDGRIPAGDAAEVADFFEEHSAWLFGHARVLTRGDRERAMDLLQDTFEAAARAWGRSLRGRSQGAQKAWLRTTLQNKEISDYRRREAFRSKLQLLSPLYQPGPGALAGELADALEQAAEIIKTLPGQQGRIARMRWELGMKVREIADELGIAEGTVHAHLNAARKKLASLLEPYRRPSAGGKGEAS
jgi:RNA polymerase sigma-70 factor, ECF subfamily